MIERSFDEMIAYFNRRVSEMDIAQDYKMELLGMVTALGYKHEKSAQQWIPCSERLPEKDGYYLVSEDDGDIEIEWYDNSFKEWGYFGVTAWMPLPEPYRKDEEKGEAE